MGGKLTTAQVRSANEAWEALFRAQVTLMRGFEAGDLWDTCSFTEYDVLYTLSAHPDGATLAEVNRQVLITQGGLSKLVTRLESRGLVERCPGARDRRSVILRLTEAGRALQRDVGRRHARQVARAMTDRLDPAQLEALRALAQRLIDPPLDAASTSRPDQRRSNI